MTETFEDIRRAVRALCSGFEGEYWRRIDAERAYPEAFVRALTEAGYLGALIPAAYGGSGLGIAEAAVILEEIQRSGCNGATCHAQMYTMGTVLRHGSETQKAELLPGLASERSASKRSALRSPPAAPTPAEFAPPPSATGNRTSLTVRRSGRHGHCIRISCCCSPARRRVISRPAPMTECQCSLSTCAQPLITA